MEYLKKIYTKLVSPLRNTRSKIIRTKRTIPLGDNGIMGNVFIGRWSYCGLSAFSGFHKNDMLEIGNFCTIASSARFIMNLGHPFSKKISNFPIDGFFHKISFEIQPNYTRIGNDVWIGEDVIILPGIRIGNGAVIGAGSVVTEDVEDFSIVGGNPARLIKWRFEDEYLRKAIQNVSWWEWTDEEVAQRADFFSLPAEEAVVFAQKKGWMRGKDIPSSYLKEALIFFSINSTVEECDSEVRNFLYRDNSAYMLHTVKSLSFENIAVWIVLLKCLRPKCIVEFGTQTGCSSKIISRLCRYLGIKTRIITVNVKDELIYPDENVEYILEDFTSKASEIWKRWQPDIIFQDAHMYHLIHQIVDESRRHRNTIHTFHDVGFRVFKNPMNISFEDVPASATGHWERHVLGLYAPDILNPCVRTFSNNELTIHIFDACADSNEYGLGILKYL